MICCCSNSLVNRMYNETIDMMTRMPNVTCEIRPPSRRAGMRPYGLAPAGAAAPAARMVMSIWRCSLLDQYFELETGSRGAARSPPCAPETGGQPEIGRAHV